VTAPRVGRPCAAGRAPVRTEAAAQEGRALRSPVRPPPALLLAFGLAASGGPARRIDLSQIAALDGLRLALMALVGEQRFSDEEQARV